MDHQHLVDVGRGLYIGPSLVCDDIGQSFGRVVHIWRDDYPTQSCKAKPGVPGDIVVTQRDFFMQYKDGDNINPDTIAKLAEFLKWDDGRGTLIHCHVGQTRSATVAVIGKLARGANTTEAVGDVVWCLWHKRKIPANIVYRPLGDILAWNDRR